MSTYIQLRRKLQLTTLALTELAGEKSQDLKRKYLRFFFCQLPEDSIDDEENIKKSSSIFFLLKNSLHNSPKIKIQKEI